MALDKAAIKKIWRRNRWCMELPPAVIEDLIDIASIRTLSDGQLLYAKQDVADGLYGVLEGAVRVGASSAEGKHAVYTILKPGSWLGEIGLFDGLHRLNNADALGSTKLLFVPTEKFHQLVERRPELYRYFLMLVCARFRGVVSLIEDRCLRGFQERLALKLVQLADQHGMDVGDGVQINLRLTQEELAYLVGTSRQRINKVLKDWEKEKLIAVKYSRITVKNKPALERLVSSI